MRIAMLASLAESVPPKLYGGTERVVAWLVDGLVELGHEVTLFASGDSHTKRLGSGARAPTRAQPAPFRWKRSRSAQLISTSSTLT